MARVCELKEEALLPVMGEDWHNIYERNFEAGSIFVLEASDVNHKILFSVELKEWVYLSTEAFREKFECIYDCPQYKSEWSRK